MTSREGAAGAAGLQRKRIRLSGIVQGVGFRPFVHRLARECDLAGFVVNSSEGVLIEVEGPRGRLGAFQERLLGETPPLARIVDFEIEDLPPNAETGFTIRASRRDAAPVALISPDVAPCDECLAELFDPRDRRHGYPFINCTNCGPRYTITRRIPYDRPNTSMSVFRQCPSCQAEYDDPSNRRFHAQPNACPACGPRVTLHDRRGDPIETKDPIGEAARLLRHGAVVAVRGIAGFHLAVDAHDDAAVRKLRRRKGRPRKPFAMMAPDVESIRRYCELSAEEERELLGPERPILLLRARPGGGIAPSVAPAQRYLGFMLPSSPLHHLLLDDRFDALVMTSGNFSEEPIATGNEEALDRLGPLADYFLLHDREILQRCDDSILRVLSGKPSLIRRSRGYVPAPLFLSRPSRRRILACGGELKNTIALSREKMVFLSQHVGDLDNPMALEFFEKSIDHLQATLEIEPEVIAHDMHPGYLSTKWALSREELPRVPVQHHHAHLAAVLADNGVTAPAIGVILDGTGYGADGTIWGGEILVGDAGSFERHAWLTPLPLPGGEAAIRQPWRLALSALRAAYGEDPAGLDLPFLSALKRRDVSIILRMLERGIHSPLSSGCGRLFDAVSALLGICSRIDYEAQAAIELEMAVDATERGVYEEALVAADGAGPLAVAPLIRAVAEDVRGREPVGRIAARFHWTLARIFARAAAEAREKYGINRVALSGGVFQNVHFLTEMKARLEESGFEVLTHGRVPPNDGGLALGQIVVADARLAAGEPATGPAALPRDGGAG